MDLAQVLNSGTARTGGAHTRTRQALVVVQLALAVMLTIVGSLFNRSALELLSVPIGFDTSKLVTFVLALDDHSPNVADRRAAVREIERLIESQAGLVAGALDRHPVAVSEAATPIAVDQVVARARRVRPERTGWRRRFSWPVGPWGASHRRTRLYRFGGRLRRVARAD